MEKFAKRNVGQSAAGKKRDSSLLDSPRADAELKDGGPLNPSIDSDSAQTTNQTNCITPNSLANADSYFDSVFNLLRCSVVVIDSELTVVWQNQAAARLLSAGDILSTSNGCLRATDANEFVRLRKFLNGVLDYCETPSEMPIFSLRCRDTDRYCEIVACPVNTDRCTPPEAHSSVGVVFVSDPQQPTSIPAPVLKSMFGLTTSESRLAQALLNGRSLEQFADEVHVSLNTARTHLKSIFRKTDTSSQASLVSLLARLVPPLTID